MTEDWAAVAQAINDRVADLGIRQRDVIERSRLSKAVVGEISRNDTPRRRSKRTLEALSTALDWHPQYLSAVLAGEEPPAKGDPAYRPDDVPARLASIERELRDIRTQLSEWRSNNDERLTAISKSLAALAECVSPDDDKGAKR